LSATEQPGATWTQRRFYSFPSKHHKEDWVTDNSLKGKWALILGASSGFGAATARALAGAGMNIAGVHLDMRATLPNAKAVVADIEAAGGRALFFNTNAADPDRRTKILAGLTEALKETGQEHVHMFMHSLAFGTLLPFITDKPEDAVSKAQMDMTLDVMANTLVYWTQDLVRCGLLGRGSRIFSMTSEGSHRVLPHYGAVSAAKAALESHTRQLALELGPRGILVNAIEAGITDTPALRKIPGHEAMLELAQRRNPGGRQTTTHDVANTILALCQPNIQFISGSVIFVDGGENAVA
jgi:NAD(P)-dependent dehydrogenase (short-subunit alcohol dehydrogenase family)